MIISMSFLVLLIKVCLSFVLGVVLYKISHSLAQEYKNYLNVLLNLDLFKLIIMILFLYMCLTYFIPFISNGFISSITVEAASNTSTPINSSSNSSNSGGDAIIMTAALATGAKLAQKAPNLATKAAVVVGSVALGASGIVVNNISGDLSSEIGKVV
jgi:hypothetical protein